MLEFNSEHVSADLSLIREKTEKMKMMGKVLLCAVTLSGVLLLSGCGQNVNAMESNVTTSVDTSSWQEQRDEWLNLLEEERNNPKPVETYEEITKTAIIFENGNCMIVELKKWEKYHQYFQNYDGVRSGSFEYRIEQQSAYDNIYALTATNGDVFLAGYNSVTIIESPDSLEKAEAIADSLVAENGKVTYYSESISYDKTRK